MHHCLTLNPGRYTLLCIRPPKTTAAALSRMGGRIPAPRRLEAVGRTGHSGCRGVLGRRRGAAGARLRVAGRPPGGGAGRAARARRSLELPAPHPVPVGPSGGLPSRGRRPAGERPGVRGTRRVPHAGSGRAGAPGAGAEGELPPAGGGRALPQRGRRPRTARGWGGALRGPRRRDGGAHRREAPRRRRGSPGPRRRPVSMDAGERPQVRGRRPHGAAGQDGAPAGPPLPRTGRGEGRRPCRKTWSSRPG
jgi:hypothetical protein